MSRDHRSLQNRRQENSSVGECRDQNSNKIRGERCDANNRPVIAYIPYCANASRIYPRKSTPNLLKSPIYGNTCRTGFSQLQAESNLLAFSAAEKPRLIFNNSAVRASNDIMFQIFFLEQSLAICRVFESPPLFAETTVTEAKTGTVKAPAFASFRSSQPRTSIPTMPFLLFSNGFSSQQLMTGIFLCAIGSVRRSGSPSVIAQLSSALRNPK